jgi:asparagine synthase (glutamine-hydrolysing)
MLFLTGVPMTPASMTAATRSSACGGYPLSILRVVINQYTSEIYNYQSLRRSLQEKGHTFSTQSDVEVIVHLYEEYGDEFLTHLEGMFGIALWDERRRRLLLARDRLGIKPVYLWRSNASLAFSSEIKSFLQLPGFSASFFNYRVSALR